MNQAVPLTDKPLKPNHWWRDDDETPALPEHILDKLVAAGLNTVGDVIAAGPSKLREIEGIGAVAITDIKLWLRKLEASPE